jgi:predicted XRE-type DNA-binding protein
MDDEPKRFMEESDHPLARLYRKRVRQNRDLVVLVTDSSNDRGTGKTTLSLRLAYGMDRTDEFGEGNGAINPHQLTEAYREQPKHSGLVLDESEVGLDKYRSGSATNKAIRELVSTGRVLEKYLVLNAPADHLVDGDLKTLVDVWILVERRGFARVFRMDWEPFRGKELTHDMGTLEWDALPGVTPMAEVYEALTEEKTGRLNGEDAEEFIQRGEAREMVENAKSEAKTNLRDEYIEQMAEKGLKQGDIGDIVGLSRSRVSQILSGNS